MLLAECDVIQTTLGIPVMGSSQSWTRQDNDASVPVNIDLDGNSPLSGADKQAAGGHHREFHWLFWSLRAQSEFFVQYCSTTGTVFIEKCPNCQSVLEIITILWLFCKLNYCNAECAQLTFLYITSESFPGSTCPHSSRVRSVLSVLILMSVFKLLILMQAYVSENKLL